MSRRLGYRGYVSSRPFGGYCIPVPIQSLVLRDYCQRNGLVYVLPVNENIFPHSYLILEGMIRDLSAYQGIAMCSIHMLPHRAERRRQIFDTVLSQGSDLRFCTEEIIVSDEAGVARLEELFALLDLAQTAPTRIPLNS